MDVYLGVEVPEAATLSYDEETTYEEQVAALPADDRSSGGLVSRISSNKVYVPPQAVFGGSKRKRDEEDSIEEQEDERDGDESNARPNALLLEGTPISRLPTGRIFGYARYFDLEPVALEWIDDTTCVLVFPSTSACKHAQQVLYNRPQDEAEVNIDNEGFYIAKPVPAPIWPPEDRINQSLGVGDGLKGTVRMRVATKLDVKRRGAKNKSEFYRRHGADAGKDPSVNTLRTNPTWGAEDERRTVLDAELEGMVADDRTDDASLLERRLSSEVEDDYEVPVLSKLRADALDADVRSGARKRQRVDNLASLSNRITSPSSRMRADYIDATSRSLLDRTSLLRAHADDLEFEGQDVGRLWDRQKQVADSGNGRRRRRGGKDRRRKEAGTNSMDRPTKTSQQLDDELDAFLREKD